MARQARSTGDPASLGTDRMEDRTALTSHAAALSIDRRLGAAGIVQEPLVDLIDLSLQGKQAHWNLRGRMFRDLHLLLDQLVEEAGDDADRLDERCLALGIGADGRVTTAGSRHASRAVSRGADRGPSRRRAPGRAAASDLRGRTETAGPTWGARPCLPGPGDRGAGRDREDALDARGTPTDRDQLMDDGAAP